MPPKLKTVSVSTAPASRPPVCRPIVVMTGSRALRMTWRARITWMVRPLDSAVRT